jgi:O-antigen/teichoic acid export membrane protein
VLSKAIYVLAVFLFIKKPEDYIYINFLLGIGLIIASLLGFFWIYNMFSFSFKKCSLTAALTLIKSEFSLTVSQLFFSFYQYAPIIIISYVCGSFIAGQYRILDQVIMIFRTYFQMFFNFIYADICLKIANNATTGVASWKIFNGFNYLIVMIIVICFYINASEILLFFKINPNDTIKLVSYLKIGLIIPVLMGISFALKQLIFAFNKNEHYIKITIFSTILSLLVLFTLLQLIGLKGAFISTIIIEFIIIMSYGWVLRNSFVKNTTN